MAASSSRRPHQTCSRQRSTTPADPSLRRSDFRSSYKPWPSEPTFRGAQERSTMPDEVRIGIWGATGSGKTMYLATLPVAGLAKQWTIAGITDESIDFSLKAEEALARAELLPGTGQKSDELAFSVGYAETIELPRTWLDRLLRRTRTARRPFGFKLVVQDHPGGAYHAQADIFDNIGDFLSACDGIVYLFDPVREGAGIEDNRFYFL